MEVGGQNESVWPFGPHWEGSKDIGMHRNTSNVQMQGPDQHLYGHHSIEVLDGPCPVCDYRWTWETTYHMDVRESNITQKFRSRFGEIMKRSELIREVAKDTGLPEEDVKAVVLTILETLSNRLSKGDSVHLWGFGKFEPRLRRAHVKLNPLLGEFSSIPEKVSVRFIPSGQLRERMNP